MREPSDEDLAFATLVGWCGYIDPLWRAYPHLVLLCRELEDFAYAIERGEERRLAVFMPPQHSKSQTVTRGFTTWLLGRWPHLRVILASYSSSYAAQWGRYARDVLTEHGQRVFGVRVSGSSSAADHWELAGHRGAFHSAGLAAGITGQPCEVGIIDDPHENRTEAESVTIRQKIVDNYKGALLTRQPRGIVLVMTRWCDGDLAGWIEENERHMGWRIVRLPAFAEENDPLGRKVGETLCPDLRPTSRLENLRATMSSYEWEGMFQQRPSPKGGGAFKREHATYYEEPTPGVFRFLTSGRVAERQHMGVFLTVDTATSVKTSADYTAIAAWGTAHGQLMLLDLDMRRIDGPQIVSAVVGMIKKWRAIPYIEDTTQSKHLLSFMRSQGLLFRSVTPGSSDKFTRALPAMALWEHGRVSLPTSEASKRWLSAFERQLYSFTGRDGGEDDAVDAFAYAAAVVQTGNLDFWRGAPDESPRPANHVEASSLGGGYPG